MYQGKLTGEYFDTLVSVKVDENNPPSSVLQVPSLYYDLETLSGSIEGESPAEDPSICTKDFDAVHGFLGESGRVLGSMIQKYKSEETNARVGEWPTPEEEE